MKRIVLAVFLLVFMVGTANAAYWKVDATKNDEGVSDFSVVFNDADNNDAVTIDDIVSFSGVYLTTNYLGTKFYDTIHKLTDIKIGVLQLVISDTDDDHWRFYSKSYGYPNFNEDNWVYTASKTSAPTPIPGAAWLLGTGVAGLFGLRRKFL